MVRFSSGKDQVPHFLDAGDEALAVNGEIFVDPPHEYILAGHHARFHVSKLLDRQIVPIFMIGHLPFLIWPIPVEAHPEENPKKKILDHA